MQAVCDSRHKIIDVFIGFPGSVHDARVFRSSPLFNTLEEKCGENYILGDSAYPCLRNLLTPYKDTGALTNVQKQYNKKLSHCRVVIEHTFGILKQKFRQLYHLKLRDITVICHFIRACCVLHNMSIEDDTVDYEFEMAVDEQTLPQLEDDIVEEDEGSPSGLLYRNYIASLLYHA